MQPFFSIIIPTKNRVDLLKVCLENIFHQTFTNFEAIVIDDGSEDSTLSFLHAIDDDRLVILANHGKGRSAARNTGLRAARGQYICFCDDDDYYQKDYLLFFYNKLIELNFPKDIVLRHNLYYFNESGILRKGPLYNVVHYRHPLLFVMHEFCCFCLLCIPAEKAKSIEFPEYLDQWEDTHYLLRLFTSLSLMQLDKVQYMYRIHDRMGSRFIFDEVNFIERAHSHIQSFKNFYLEFNHLHPLFTKNNFNKIISKKYMEYASDAMGLKQYKISFHLLRYSLCYGVFWNNRKNYLVFIRNLIFDKSEDYKST